jgi:hypothetical protein
MTRTKALTPPQAARLTELRTAAAQANALYQEAVNVLALELVSSEEVPRAQVNHLTDSIDVTVMDA